MPEIIDPVFAKTSQNARFLLSENERFGLVFVKTGSINSGTGGCKQEFNIIYARQLLDSFFKIIHINMPSWKRGEGFVLHA